MKPAYKRIRLWVDPPFQCRLLLRMSLYFLVYAVTVFHVAFFFAILANVRDTFARGIADYYCAFLGQFQPFLWASAMTMPYLFYDLLKFSHRIAGPLYRCRKVMQAMTGGQPVAEFTPRKHDLMRELTNSLNALIKEWNARGGTAGKDAA